MRISIIAFSGRGEEVAGVLCDKLTPTDEAEYTRCGSMGLGEWTREKFLSSDALIFVGACGIAVRAVAPFIRDKTSDPAVVVVDELGQYAISLLSGHLGGANELTRRVAKLLGAEAVITTATDVNEVFAIDDWARMQNLVITDTSLIKEVSSRLLDGGEITIKSNFPIPGKPPRGVVLTSGEGADVHISTRREGIFGGRQTHPGELPMILVPRVASLGVGCRRGASYESIEKCFLHVLDRLDLFEEAVFGVFSIDIKSREPGLLEFCKKRALPLRVFSAQELRKVRGEFSSSDFVEGVTGVDNVCERSAVLGAGYGRLVLKKTVWEGVTMAVAFSHIALGW